MEHLWLLITFMSFFASAETTISFRGEAEKTNGEWKLYVEPTSNFSGKNIFRLQNFPPAEFRRFNGTYLYGDFLVTLTKWPGEEPSADVKNFVPKVNDPLAKMPEFNKLRETAAKWAAQKKFREKEKGFTNGP